MLGKERAIVATGMGTGRARTKAHKSLANVTIGNSDNNTSAVKSPLEHSPDLWQSRCLNLAAILALILWKHTRITSATCQQAAGGC